MEPALSSGMQILVHPREKRPVPEHFPDLVLVGDERAGIADDRVGRNLRRPQTHAFGDKRRGLHRPQERTCPESHIRGAPLQRRAERPTHLAPGGRQGQRRAERRVFIVDLRPFAVTNEEENAVPLPQFAANVVKIHHAYFVRPV